MWIFPRSFSNIFIAIFAADLERFWRGKKKKKGNVAEVEDCYFAFIPGVYKGIK